MRETDADVEYLIRGKTSQVQAIVSEVAKGIKTLGSVLIKDPSTYVIREKQVEILKSGLACLDAILVSFLLVSPLVVDFASSQGHVHPKRRM